MAHALFIWLKYRGGLPSCGECGWENIVEPFRTHGIGSYDMFFYDTYADQASRDRALFEQCASHHYDMVFLYWMPDAGLWHLNVSPDVLYRLSFQLKLRLVALWYDTWHPLMQAQVLWLLPLCDLAVVTDSLRHFAAAERAAGILGLCYTPDVTVFTPGQGPRDILVSHNGSVACRPEREAAIEAVRQAGIPIVCTGGFDDANLEHTAYAAIYQRSRMTVNFSQTPTGKRTFKARVMEALLCGTLLLEQDNQETADRFTPFEHYVPFEGADDLVAKIRHYARDEAARSAIAAAGLRRARELAGPQGFWGAILDRLATTPRPDPDVAARAVPVIRDHLERLGRPPDNALENLAALQGRTVAIWGHGGRYREVFAPWLAANKDHFHFVGFLDSREDAGGQVDGYPVHPGSAIPGLGLDAVILATYAWRDLLHTRPELFGLQLYI